MSLKPGLILGTGFHRWVLGDAAARERRPLTDWSALLEGVAIKLGVVLPDGNEDSALRWEMLLTTAAQDNFLSQTRLRTTQHVAHVADKAMPVNQIERHAKKAVQSILTERSAGYPAFSMRAQLPLAPHWGAVVSLNFDKAWQQQTRSLWNFPKNERTVPVVVDNRVEFHRLNRCQYLMNSAGEPLRVWYPNGHVQVSTSLRLGLREFGFQPVAIYQAVNALMAYENTCGAKESEVGFAKYIQGIAPILEGQASLHEWLYEQRLPMTWVTEMLYRPVVFAGVGLSSAEAGLWWLLVQRARNFANVREENRPSAAILVRRDDVRLSFWQTRPCGIVPLICDDWNDGWGMVQKWGKEQAGRTSIKLG